MGKYKDFEEFGRKGGLQKGVNYRKYLVDELSKVCEKEELNYYMAFSTKALQEALLIKQGKNK